MYSACDSRLSFPKNVNKENINKHKMNRKYKANLFLFFFRFILWKTPENRFCGHYINSWDDLLNSWFRSGRMNDKATI